MAPPPDLTVKQLAALLQAKVDSLMEHFDSVQILVSFRSPKDGGTAYLARGGGNWYARQGMAHEFINADRAQIEAHELSKILPSPDSD